MVASITRLCLFLAVALLAASVGTSQPLPSETKSIPIPKTKWQRDPYTAFPDLKPSTTERKEVKKPNGDIEIVFEEKGVVPLPPIPEIAANAPPLRRVRLEQLYAGLAYVERTKEIIRVGSYSREFYHEFLQITADTYRVAAELEETPAKRIPWYEGRVRVLKEFERFTENRVTAGTDPPQRLDLARFQRLQAEAELLKLKAEADKPEK